MSKNDENIRQTFYVTVAVTALGRHSVGEVQELLRDGIHHLPLNMRFESLTVMQATENNAATGDFICYDITSNNFTPERLQGVDPHTPWTEHEDHSLEEHLA